LLKNNIILKFTLIGLLLSYGGCSDKTNNEAQKNVSKPQSKAVSKEVAKPKPIIFEFPDSTGKIIKITFDNQKIVFNNFPNKIVMVDFFGQHCPPCLAEIPHLSALQKKYKKEFVILGIQVQKRMNVFDRANFIKSHGINYIVVDDDRSWDFTGFIQQVLGWKGSIPFMLMFTPDGQIFTHYSGMAPQEMIEGDIKKMLGLYPSIQKITQNNSKK
jgi:thiol-disulfide isomerase/thioredoxin